MTSNCARKCFELLWFHDREIILKYGTCLAFVQMTTDEDLMDAIEDDEKKGTSNLLRGISNFSKYCSRIKNEIETLFHE